MTEYIMKEEKDMDGVYCYIRKGELIRCKDCKYSEKSGKNVDCRKLHMLMYNDEYCSMAKRKES